MIVLRGPNNVAQCHSDIQKLAEVGFAEEFKPKWPMERRRYRGRVATIDEWDHFQAASDATLWDWQARCKCGRIRDRIELKAHGGLCERCRQEEKES